MKIHSRIYVAHILTQFRPKHPLLFRPQPEGEQGKVMGIMECMYMPYSWMHIVRLLGERGMVNAMRRLAFARVPLRKRRHETIICSMVLRDAVVSLLQIPSAFFV